MYKKTINHMRQIWYLLILTLFMFGCSSSQRYPNWEYVRIEYSKPSNACVYKIQEACNSRTALEGCLNWYKKRATLFNANTVVLTGDTMADYFACPSSKP